MKKENSLFIDGKKQAVEILKLLSLEEKTRILNNISAVNASLAKELETKSLSLEALCDFSSSKVNLLIKDLPDQIIGLALKKVPLSVQKKVLRKIEANRAERIYQTLVFFDSADSDLITKAYEKVMLEFIEKIQALEYTIN